MARILPSNARIIPSEAVKVFSGIIYDVYQWDQTLYDGSKAKFEMLKRPDTVATVCIKDDQIVYVEEFQPSNVHRVFFPTGRVDPGESWAEAAKREVREETGLSFKDWKLVYVAQPLEKIEWFVAWYVAWSFDGETETTIEQGEKITIKVDTLAKALEKITAHAVKNKRFGYTPDFILKAKSLQDIIDLPEFKSQ